MVEQPMVETEPESNALFDIRKGWQDSTIAYLAQHEPHFLQNLIDGKFEPMPELTDQMMQAAIFEDDEPAPADAPVLSMHTDIPNNIAEAMSSPDWKFWLQAMNIKADTLDDMRTYHRVPREVWMKIISARFVFARKFNSTGGTIRFRARWVARGFLQRYGIHFRETFAAVISTTVNRAIYVIATSLGWWVITVDFVSAFLNGTLPPEIRLYIELPPAGRQSRGNEVGLLRQGLYGLRQAARLWYEAITGHLISLGFQISRYDAGLLFHKDKQVWLTFHVDDVRVFSPHKANAEWAIEQMKSKYELKRVTSQCYLGQVFEDKQDSVYIHQKPYVDTILAGARMEQTTGCSVPFDPGLKKVLALSEPHENESDGESPTQYRSILGSLLYLATMTRPDIAYTVNFLTRYNRGPTKEAWVAVRQLLRYLDGTRSMGFTIRKSNTTNMNDLRPVTYSDSDWAGADSSYRSTSGFVTMMNGVPVAWRSQRQCSISKSTTEAEYISASDAAADLLWLNDLLHEAHLLPTAEETNKVIPPTLFMDNKGAIDLIHSENVNRRSRHIEVRYHLIRDWVRTEALRVVYVSTDNNIADGLTKVLPSYKHRSFVTALNLN